MSDQADPVIRLPVRGPSFERPGPDLLASFAGVSAATACARLHGLGVRRSFVRGPRPLAPGRRLVGSAVTLQFMPQREDVASGLSQEYVERGTALWAVLDTIGPGDVLVIQAYGSRTTGCMGDMLSRYLLRRGGVGLVVDGCIRDAGKVLALGLPVWAVGTTPQYASQEELFPWAYDVPIACGGVLVLPGDVVVADDDGTVVVPRRLAPRVVELARAKEAAEAFARERLDAGGDLADYYPLSDRVRPDFAAWSAARGDAAAASIAAAADSADRP